MTAVIIQRITDLPHEILEDIFLNVVSYTDPHPTDQRTELYRWQSYTHPISTAPHIPSYRSSASPYSITHVSRQWRSIALNYPHLWTHLRVIKPEKNDIIHILKEWIHRARSLPLYLSLFQHSEKWGTVKEVLCLFLRSIHRCVSLTMYLKPIAEESFDFVTTLDVQTPNLLESVGFVSYRHSNREVGGDNSLANLFLCSPKIHCITWSQSNQFDVEDNVLHCWGNLKVLELDNSQECITIMHILLHCHNLEVFIATSPIHDPIDTQGLKPVTLTKLVKLSVRAIANSSSKIFKWLIVPSLLELEIDVFNTAEWDVVADMLERSGASLRVLNVSGDCFSEDDFLPILRRPCFVGLKELRMADSGFQNTLRFLTCPPSLGWNDNQESRNLRHLEQVILQGIDLESDYQPDEDPPLVLSALVMEMAKSRLGTCDSERIHRYLDVDLSNDRGPRVYLTIPPVPGG